jgi:hypothetical protein
MVSNPIKWSKTTPRKALQVVIGLIKQKNVFRVNTKQQFKITLMVCFINLAAQKKF